MRKNRMGNGSNEEEGVGDEANPAGVTTGLTWKTLRVEFVMLTRCLMLVMCICTLSKRG